MMKLLRKHRDWLMIVIAILMGLLLPAVRGAAIQPRPGPGSILLAPEASQEASNELAQARRRIGELEAALGDRR